MKRFLTFICLIVFTTIYSSTAVFADTVYDENNQLLYYSDLYSGSEVMTVPQVSKENALDIAVDFTEKFCPEISDNINIDNVTVTHTKSYPTVTTLLFRE